MNFMIIHLFHRYFSICSVIPFRNFRRRRDLEMIVVQQKKFFISRKQKKKPFSEITKKFKIRKPHKLSEEKKIIILNLKKSKKF